MGHPKRKADVIDIFTKKPVQNSIKDEIKEALQEEKGHAQSDEETEKTRKPRKSDSSDQRAGSGINISVQNNSGNVVGSVGDNARIISKTTKIVKGPAPDTIGAHGHMVQAVIDRINELAMTRITDFVKQGKYFDTYSAKGPVYNGIRNTFYREFSLPKRKHRDRQIENIVKEWNVNRFQEVIDYFDEKLSRTVTGKIKAGRRKETGKTPFYELMQMETALLKKIGLKYDSPVVRDALQRYYGVTSHKHLETYQHKEWISRIESVVDLVERGVLHTHNVNL